MDIPEKTDELMEKRRNYTSLDDMAREEGVLSVLSFLAYNPSIVGEYYKNTNIPIVHYEVKKWRETSEIEGSYK